MIKIFFVGSIENIKFLENKLKDHVVFTNLLSEADCIIVEYKPQYLKFLMEINTKKPCLYLVNNGKWRQISLTGRYIFTSQHASEILNIVNNVLPHEKEKVNKSKSSILTDSKIIQEANKIPVLPNTIIDLINMTHDPDKSSNSIIDVIKKDQGLVSEVLHLVNSPFYSFIGCIDSIDRAIVLLGFDEIKKLITAVKVKPFFEKNFKFYNESGFRMWMHSFNVAKMCYNVAKSFNNSQINKESIYLAGLMHDIGKTILVDFLDKPVFEPEDEKAQTGYTHMEVGSIVLRHWNVSEEIIDSVLNHHAISDKLFNRILYFANKRERTDKINNKLKEDIDKHFGFNN